MSYTIESPFQYFPDPTKFGTLGLGSLYVGIVEGSPYLVPAQRQQVYIAVQGQPDLPISQPIALGAGGVPLYNGSPCTLKIDAEYSIAVVDYLGAQVYYSPQNGEEIAAIDDIQTQIDALDNDAQPVINSWAAISSRAVSAPGELFYLKQNISNGIGAGTLISKAGSVTDDGGTKKNSATAGFYLERIIESTTAYAQWWGVNGSGDETAKITLIESAAFLYVDLGGLTVTVTTPTHLLTKSYFNGKLVGGNQIIFKNEEITRPEYLDQTSGTKCRVLSWAGKKLLWNGTSIPAFGGLGSYTYGQPLPGDSYPFLFGQAMGCSVKNYAWATSYAHFDRTTNAFTGVPVRPLSMTDDDRVALLALYGSGSDYSDTLDPVTKPSEMTADFRIKAQFVAGQIDVVVLDHNHNDQLQLPGTLTPESRTITAISKGVTTSITLSSIGTIVVGDGVALDSIAGIPKLNYAAARVQSVAGNVITINIDSSGFAGSFTSGSVKKLDRNTIYGAWDFLIYYIKNMSLRYNSGVVDIILNGAPSNFTNNTNTPAIYSISRYIKDVADKWGLSYFDIATALNLQAADHIYYLPDLVHPSTIETRKVIAAYWVDWASGGSVLKKDDNAYLPMAIGTLQEQRDPWYSRYYGGFTTANHFVAEPVSLFTEDFSGTLAAWTLGGTGVPTIVTAPWNAAQKAVKFPITNVNTTSNISRSAAFQQGVSVQFDVAISSTSITASSFAICNVMVIGHPNTGNHYVVNIVATPTTLSLRIEAYTGLASTGNVTVYDLGAGSLLAGATKRNIKIQAFRELGTDKGSILLYMDNSTTPYAAPYRISDASQINNTAIYFGSTIFNNTGGTFDLYVGNIAVGSITVSDMSTRFTGTSGTSPNLLTFVNGVCVSKT